MHGTSPTAELDFTAQGQLRHAHLERGVTMQSESEPAWRAAGQTLAREPDLALAGGGCGLPDDCRQSAGKTQVEPETIHGTGGVVVTSESRRGNAAAVPAKMAADEVTGTFGAGLGAAHAGGHGARADGTDHGDGSAANGKRRPVGSKFCRGQGTDEPRVRSEMRATKLGSASGAPDVQTAELDGHVVLFQQPAAKPGAEPATAACAPRPGKRYTRATASGCTSPCIRAL